MPNNSGTLLIAPIRPQGTLDTFPTHYADEALGGYHVVADNTALLAIPALRREDGMIVFVTGENRHYQLKGGIADSNWESWSIMQGRVDVGGSNTPIISYNSTPFIAPPTGLTTRNLYQQYAPGMVHSVMDIAGLGLYPGYAYEWNGFVDDGFVGMTLTADGYANLALYSQFGFSFFGTEAGLATEFKPFEVNRMMAFADNGPGTKGMFAFGQGATAYGDFNMNFIGAGMGPIINLFLFSTGLTSADQGILRFGKTHRNDNNALTATVDTEPLGLIEFKGIISDDSNQSTYDAHIRAVQNGAADADGVPVDLFLEASDGAAWNTNQLVLSHNGFAGFGVAVPLAPIHVARSGTAGADTVFLQLANMVDNTTGTGTVLLFSQDKGGTLYNIGQVIAKTRNSLSSAVSQTSAMIFQTMHQGTLADKLSIREHGDIYNYGAVSSGDYWEAYYQAAFNVEPNERWRIGSGSSFGFDVKACSKAVSSYSNCYTYLANAVLSSAAIGLYSYDVQKYDGAGNPLIAIGASDVHTVWRNLGGGIVRLWGDGSFTFGESPYELQIAPGVYGTSASALRTQSGLNIQTGYNLDSGIDLSLSGQCGFTVDTHKYLQLDFTNVTWDATITAMLGDLTLDCHSGNTIHASKAMKCAAAWACNNATPQTAYASGGALAAYATGAYGLDSNAHMQALFDLVVSIRAALVANGIMS
jgi:hypothetical protein